MWADDQNSVTNNPANDIYPSWFDPAYAQAVSPAGKLAATWGNIKAKYTAP